MRVVFHIISTGASGGPSRATRYIAERDKDPTREGPGDRPLFSEEHDNLTYRKADRILDRFDGQPQKEDLAHLSISFLEEDFAKLGHNEKERQERLREVIREGMKGMADELKVEGLTWVAGTENPHAHVVLRDQAVSQSGVVERQFGLLRTSLMPHKRMVDGKEVLVPGRIGDRFIRALDRQQEHFLNPDRTRAQAYEFWERVSRSVQRSDSSRTIDSDSAEQTRDDKLTRQFKARRQSIPRDVDHQSVSGSWNRNALAPETAKTDYRIALGKHLEMSMRLAFAEVWYERAVKHGDTYRFEVLDQSTGEERKLSELDVHRRATARAQRIGISDRNIRAQAYDADLSRHRETLDQLLETREAKIAALGKDVGSLRTTVAKVETGLRSRTDTPSQKVVTPLMSRETLSELQSTAIRLILPQNVDELEKLRLTLAREYQTPTRTDDELAKLVAQVNVSRSDLLAKNTRIENFEASLHLTPYEAHGERWSLGALDKQIARRREESKFVPDRAARLDLRSLTRFNYSPAARERATSDIEHLRFIRGEIVSQIKARREPLIVERDRACEIVEVLDEAYDREQRTLKLLGKEVPEPKYEVHQMRSLEASAEVLRDPTLLREVHEWEKSFSRSESDMNWQGRAVAREIMSGIAAEEAKERLQNFVESKRVASLNLGHYRTGAVREVEAHSLTDYLARLLETPGQRDYRHSINLAAHEHHERLHNELGKTHAYHEATRDLASAAHGHDAQFTDKEKINLEIYAERQNDDMIRNQFLELARADTVSDREVAVSRDR